ncbi:uncharacterized protein B0T23DRAFT_327423, partial [Neurospora hispaniola]
YYDLWCGIFDYYNTFGPRTSLSKVISVLIRTSFLIYIISLLPTLFTSPFFFLLSLLL